MISLKKQRVKSALGSVMLCSELSLDVTGLADRPAADGTPSF